MQHAIPEDPSAMTPDWLTIALREAEVLNHAVVTRVEPEVIGEDRGFTGVVARLWLQYDRIEPEAPPTLIAKFPLAQRATASTYRDSKAADPRLARQYLELCAREVDYYRVIAPHGAPSPRAYVALADIEAERMLLLLEDLSHGEPGDAVRGCTVGQSRIVVEAIAAFHARWWEHSSLASLDWLPAWGHNAGARAERFRAQADPFLERHGDHLSAEVQDLVRDLPGHYEATLLALNGPPSTVVHADLHLDNVIFVSSGAVPTAKIIDWQAVAHGAGAIDLSLFIVGALGVEERRAAEHDLLRRYHQILSESGVNDYTFDQLLHDYRLTLLWQLAGTVGWLSKTDAVALEGRERELVDAIFTRGQLFAALQDHLPDLPRRH